MEFISSLYEDYQFDRKNGAIQALRSHENPFVPGSGSRVPRAIFIGMFPKAIETKNRRPLSGRIGDKFEEIINDAGMLRSDVFITYVVKYPMPSTRSPSMPTVEEVAESIPLLRREIAILGRGEGRTIVTMGLPVLKALISTPVTSVGHTFEFDRWKIFSIEDPREVLSGNDKNAQLKFRQAMNAIGQYVNDMVE